MPTTVIPARTGGYVYIKEGQRLKLTNTHGNQIIDFWAFAFPAPAEGNITSSADSGRSMIRGDISSGTTALKSSFPFVFGVQYFSASRTRSVLSKLIPSAKDQDVLYSKITLPMFTFVEDTRSGVHDTLFGCCDRFRYHQLGEDYCHASCSANMHLALREAAKAGVFAEQSISSEWTPDPLKIFINIPIITGLRREEGGGGIESVPPESKPVEYVVLRAECDVLAVMSACPNDVIPGVNGGKCVDVEYEMSE